MTPEYPKGHDAQNCPLDNKRITLQATPNDPDVVTPPAALRMPKVQRALTADQLHQVCRQVGSLPFDAGQYTILSIGTSTAGPGLYYVSVKANLPIRTLHVYTVGGEMTTYVLVNNNQLDHTGGQFLLPQAVRIQIKLAFHSTNTAGEIALFRLGPQGYLGPPS